MVMKGGKDWSHKKAVCGFAKELGCFLQDDFRNGGK